MASKALARQGFSALALLCTLAIAAPVEAQASDLPVPATETHHAKVMHVAAHKGIAHRMVSGRNAHRAVAPGVAARYTPFQKVVWLQNIPHQVCVSLACPNFIILGVGY